MKIQNQIAEKRNLIVFAAGFFDSEVVVNEPCFQFRAQSQLGREAESVPRIQIKTRAGLGRNAVELLQDIHARVAAEIQTVLSAIRLCGCGADRQHGESAYHCHLTVLQDF